jgi:CheY-like chemotaxis protein/two-component sensor histidine kinase
MLDLLDLA